MSENKVIFISYSSKNTEIAEKARDYLEENGLNCWMAPRDIKTSDNYAQEIMDGLINAKMVLLVFSKDSHDSKYVRQELNNAFIRDKPILPFKIDDTLPSGGVEFILRNQQWLDASSDPESFFDEMLEDANRILKGIPFPPVEILLSEKLGSNLDSPGKIEGLYQNIGNASKVIMNFDGIDDMSDEFALEYLSQKKKKNYSVIEINRSEKIKRIFKNVSSPQEPEKRNILLLVAVAAVILIAVGAFVMFGGSENVDEATPTGVAIDYVQMDDDSSKGYDWKYSYFVFGSVTDDVANSSDYKVHIEFLDDSGKVLNKNDTKVSKIEGGILATAYLNDDNVKKVTAELRDGNGKVINSTETTTIK